MDTEGTGTLEPGSALRQIAYRPGSMFFGVTNDGQRDRAEKQPNYAQIMWRYIPHENRTPGWVALPSHLHTTE